MNVFCDYDKDDICTTCGVRRFASPAPRICRMHTDDSVVQPEPSHAEEMPARGAPDFLTKVRNFASATVSHVAAGMPMCDDAEIIRRHDICLTCEHLQNDACQLCGCPVARAAGYVSKLSWADQECPAGKWGPVA